jgi:hypothetical protein
MQHDMSPHEADIDGRAVRVQTASLVLCYSRMVFTQMVLAPFPRYSARRLPYAQNKANGYKYWEFDTFWGIPKLCHF